MCDRGVSLLLLLALLPGCAPDETPTKGANVERLGAPRPVSASEPAPDTTGGLRQRVEAALVHVRQRDLLTTNSFWTVFHGILGVGPDATLFDAESRQRVNALDHISRGGQVRGLQFIPTAHGLDVQMGPAFVGQGHQDQFIAEMAQWGMPLERRFLVHGKEYTFADFVRHAQMRTSVTGKQELSWAILIVAQYQGTDAKWTNAAGEKLTLEDVVRYELNQPIEDAACGGTHRLFGLTWALHVHRTRGGTNTPLWEEVAKKNAKYREIARRQQNPDGSFSTRYLAGPGNSRELDLRVNTTGHVLEWLALALDEKELRQGWVQEAANALSLMILDSASRPIDSGSLYHATHGLHLYHARLWGRSRVTHPGLLHP